MTESLKKLGPYAAGLAIAAIIAVFPEVKPIACGVGFALPAILQ